MKIFFLVLPVTVVVLAGCGSGNTELMPLTESSHWSYLVHSVPTYSEDVKVSRKLAVGDAMGYELKGDLGVCHLAWSKGRLISDQMANARFTPPLPILAPNEKRVSWAGTIISGEKSEAAKAQVVNEHKNISVVGVPTDTVQSVVAFQLEDKTMTLSTWFQPQFGIVRQEQRTNGRVDLILEYLERG